MGEAALPRVVGDAPEGVGPSDLLLDDPEVRAWNAAQNRRTRVYLDQLPFRDQLYGRLRRLTVEASSDYFALKPCAGKLFAIKR